MKSQMQTLIIFVLLVILLVVVNQNRLHSKNADANFAALTDTVNYYTNKLGTQTAGIKVLQLQQNQLKETILSKDKELSVLTKEFKSVTNVIKYRQLIKTDTIKIVFKDSVPCIFKKSGSLQSPWYSLKYNATHTGFTVDSLTISNQTTVINGFTRKWFLGEDVLTTTITNSNPYVNVASLQSAVATVPVPWYKKWYVWALCGMAGGLIISK